MIGAEEPQAVVEQLAIGHGGTCRVASCSTPEREVGSGAQRVGVIGAQRRHPSRQEVCQLRCGFSGTAVATHNPCELVTGGEGVRVVTAQQSLRSGHNAGDVVVGGVELTGLDEAVARSQQEVVSMRLPQVVPGSGGQDHGVAPVGLGDCWRSRVLGPGLLDGVRGRPSNLAEIGCCVLYGALDQCVDVHKAQIGGGVDGDERQCPRGDLTTTYTGFTSRIA